MIIYAEKKNGKKEGSTYVGLFADLGYKTICITFDTNVICALLDITQKQFAELPLNERVIVK